MQKHHMLPYILPAVTIVALALVFTNPGITGFVATPAGGGELSAWIMVVTSPDQVMPIGSIVSIHIFGTPSSAGGPLTGQAAAASLERDASMAIEDFIQLSGEQFETTDGQLPAIEYSGPGYTGSYNYTIGLSEFGIDRALPPGNYTLRTEVSYNGNAITSVERSVAVS